MGPLGWQETVFIFVLALLVFGPKKLPELGKTIGKALTEFRRASSELKATFDREMTNLERENDSLREVTQSYQNEISSNYDYDYNYSDSSGYDSGAYGSESGDSTATNPSTVSASAPEGAEPTANAGEDAAAVVAASAEEPAAGGTPAEEVAASASSNGLPASEPREATA